MSCMIEDMKWVVVRISNFDYVFLFHNYKVGNKKVTAPMACLDLVSTFRIGNTIINTYFTFFSSIYMSIYKWANLVKTYWLINHYIWQFNPKTGTKQLLFKVYVKIH